MDENIDDDRLANALERRTPVAEEIYYARFRPPLVAYALKCGFSLMDAEDLAQDSLVQGWACIKSFRRGVPLKRWLVGIE